VKQRKKENSHGQKAKERKERDREDYRQGNQKRQEDRQEDGKERLLDEISYPAYSPACIEFLHNLY